MLKYSTPDVAALILAALLRNRYSKSRGSNPFWAAAAKAARKLALLTSGFLSSPKCACNFATDCHGPCLSPLASGLHGDTIITGKKQKFGIRKKKEKKAMALLCSGVSRGERVGSSKGLRGLYMSFDASGGAIAETL